MPPEAHPALAAVRRLERVRDALAVGAVPDADDADWVAGCIARHLAAPEQVDMDAAFGLAVRPGGLPWWQIATHAERDDLLRAIAKTIPGRTHTKAVGVQQRLRRYAGTSWPRDRVSKQPSSVNATLFAIFALDPHPPTGIRQLTTIIQQ
jgi:hypothetical protein